MNVELGGEIWRLETRKITFTLIDNFPRPRPWPTVAASCTTAYYSSLVCGRLERKGALVVGRLRIAPLLASGGLPVLPPVNGMLE